MSRRLPYPYHTDDPLGPAPKPSAHDKAIAYAKWRAARDGIEWPEGSGTWGHKLRVEFSNGCCVVYETHAPVRTWHHRRAHYTPSEHIILLKLPLPPWAMPVGDAYWWHQAHQAGVPPEECSREGYLMRQRAWHAERERRQAAQSRKGDPDNNQTAANSR